MSSANTRSSLALLLGLASGMAVGRVGTLGAMLTSMMIYGKRQPLWQHPIDHGLRAETVVFHAEDGVTLRGWLLQAAVEKPAPTAVFVHGWPWNRCGNQAGHLPILDQTVDFFMPAIALLEAGMHVLLFDLRNHGMSDAAPPVTFGLREARDLQAAVRFLRGRPEVDPQQILPIGFSMGANTVLYALPDIQPIPAAVLVQPVRIGTFARNFSASVLGPVGPTLLSLAEPFYRSMGGPPLDAIDPSGAAVATRDTALLFVQGSGDQWGNPDDVRAMASAAPRASFVMAPSTERYGGYQWLGQHLPELVGFLRTHTIAPGKPELNQN